MKVTDTRNNIIPFTSIKRGECFLCDDDYYMRTNNTRDEGLELFNAVNLETGFLCSFDDEDEVISLDAEVILTSK